MQSVDGSSWNQATADSIYESYNTPALRGADGRRLERKGVPIWVCRWRKMLLRHFQPQQASQVRLGDPAELLSQSERRPLRSAGDLPATFRVRHDPAGPVGSHVQVRDSKRFRPGDESHSTLRAVSTPLEQTE